MRESQNTRSSAAPAGVRPLAVALIALGLGLAACGGDSDSDSSTPTTTTPTATVAPATTAAAATTTPATTVPAEAATTTVKPESEDCPSFTENEELPVKICDTGELVVEVQQGLVDEGYEIVVDSFFGAQTRNAVFEFQAANGLEVDGVVGPLTFEKLFPT